MTESSDTPPPPGRTPALPGHWRSEFPYQWDADDLVSRRELLHFAVLTSGALFGGTTLLAILRQLSSLRRGTPQAIVQASQVAEGEWISYFSFLCLSKRSIIPCLHFSPYFAKL